VNVLIVAEDHRNDQYILRPIVRALLSQVGKPHANVKVPTRPRLRGLPQVLNRDNIRNVILLYPETDLFLVCVDRDGRAERRAELDALEEYVAAEGLLRPGQALFAQEAHQELEVWLLAGHNLPKDWSWRALRAEPHPKEAYFEPFAVRTAVANGVGGGRKILAEDAAQQYAPRVRRLCPELAKLEARILSWIKATSVT